MDHRAAVVEEILKGAHAGVLPAVRWTDIKGDPSPYSEEGDECSTRAGGMGLYYGRCQRQYRQVTDGKHCCGSGEGDGKLAASRSSHLGHVTIMRETSHGGNVIAPLVGPLQRR